MAGPHRALADTRNAVESAFRDAGVDAGSRVLLAVSGGSDSMALAQAALFVASRAGVLAASMTVDHGWRPDSLKEARATRDRLAGLGADPALVVTLDCDARRGAGGPEAASRAARYAALARAARTLGGEPAGSRPPATVLLGHTADDQAETVLLGLARGSGARSIAGMPAASTVPGAPDVRALRPFLGLRRSLLREALASEGVGWVEDPTNGPDSPVRAADGTPLRRAAVRHHSLPALEEDLGPGVVEALARTAALLRADTEALDSIACEHATRLGSELDVDGLRSLPQAVRTRILRSAAIAAGARPGELTSWHIIRLDGLVASRRSGACLHLPGVGVELSAGRVIFDSAGARRRKEGRGRA